MLSKTIASIILIALGCSCTPLPTESLRHIDAMYWEYRLNTRMGTVSVDHRGTQASVGLQLTVSEIVRIFFLADSLDFWSITPEVGMQGSGIDPSPGMQFIELTRGDRKKRVTWEEYAHLTQEGDRLGPIWRAIGIAMRSHREFEELPSFLKF